MTFLLKNKSYDLRLELVVTLRLPWSHKIRRKSLKKNRCCYGKKVYGNIAALLIFDKLQRRDIRKQRVFRDRRNPLDYLTDGEIREKYRLPRFYLLQLVELVRSDLEKPTQRSQPISPTIQVKYFRNQMIPCLLLIVI